MEIDGYVKPVNDFYNSILIKETHLGSTIFAYHEKDKQINWSNFKVALIGLPNQIQNECGEYEISYEIRKQLALLAKASKPINIVDVGNIIKGATPKDTAFAIGQVVAQLHQHNIATILLGGSSDFGLGNFLAFAANKKTANIISIDSKIHLLFEGDRMSDSLTLDEIVFRNSEYLFNFTNIGYQTYYVPQKELDLLEDLYFDAYRLGNVRNNTKDYEPLLRDADIVNLSFNAIKFSDSPSSSFPSPNGLTGDEACQLSFYSGLSGKTFAFGVYDIEVTNDKKISCALASQSIWYFLEGFSNRFIENPRTHKEQFISFTVNNEQTSQEFIFYKSRKSNRWWVEIPVKEKSLIISCSLMDYEQAINQEIPDRWWKMFQKLN